jgi:hypothetical protein
MCCENELPFRYSSLLLICNTGGNVKFVVFNSNYSMFQHILHLRKHIIGSNESNHARDDGWTLVKAKAKDESPESMRTLNLSIMLARLNILDYARSENHTRRILELLL